MTPKEKAKGLVDKYYQLAESIEWTDNETKVKAEKFNDELGSDVLKYWHLLAKECALMAVDEIIRTLNEDIRDIDVRGNILLDLIDYWKEVKQEIKKL
jgi:hypothetical protein